MLHTMERTDATLLLAAAGLVPPVGTEVTIAGADPVLASRHHVGEAAAAAAGLAAAWAARFGEGRGLPPQSVEVDVAPAAAGLLGFALQSLDGKAAFERVFSPVTAMFRTSDDRLIHLHGGFDHLAEATCRLLQTAPEPGSLATAVASWEAQQLEDALADAGLCGAIVRSPEEWGRHPQGRAVAALPAVRLTRIGDTAPIEPGSAARPLSGIRVLDLTRVLAGPTAGRTLAAHGADVLRLDSPTLPSIEVFDLDTGRGKRSAWADLDDPLQAEHVAGLVAGADVVVQSYRPGSLDARGLSPAAIAERRPGAVVVRLSCYGPEGPWAARRGWEQLAQSAVGLAWAEEPGEPRLVPAAATDYTTGYLAAAGAAEALCRRAEVGGSWLVEVSLAQTAAWLGRLGADLDPGRASGFGELRRQRVPTAWGTLTHLAPIERLSVTPPRWDTPPVPRGASRPEWLPVPGFEPDRSAS
jgi:crotonobetainyl-CoA:carnitine CoA-transferase CaiB-like acyl-CoA transferase